MLRLFGVSITFTSMSEAENLLWYKIRADAWIVTQISLLRNTI